MPGVGFGAIALDHVASIVYIVPMIEDYETRKLKKQVAYARMIARKYRLYFSKELDPETRDLCDRAHRYFASNQNNLEQARWIFAMIVKMFEKYVEMRDTKWQTRERDIATWHFGFFKNSLLRDLRKWELAT